MADLTITSEGLGTKFADGNNGSAFTLNEFSVKRNNPNDGTIQIVSDLIEPYAKLAIRFDSYDNVYYNAAPVADIDALETILEDISQNNVGIIANGGTVGVQNPLPCDGDRIYTKDLDLTRSDNYGFGSSVDDIENLFTGLHNALTDSSGTSPKELLIHFNWSIVTSGIAIECNEPGDFSNVKIEVLRGGGTSILIADESADSTKHKTRFFSFAGSALPIPPILGINAIKLTFTTTDAVCITNIVVPKVQDRNTFLITQNVTDNSLEYVNSSQGYLNVFTAAKMLEKYVNKWGQNNDIDTGTVPETIWDGSDIYTYSDSFSGETYQISSDTSGDTEIELTMELVTLDTGTDDYHREFVTTALNATNAQTPVTVVTPSGRPAVACNRAYNSNGDEFAGTIYVYDSTATVVAGVPDDIADVKAIVTPEAQQTRQAIYVVPNILEDGTLINECHVISWSVSVIKRTAVVLDAFFMVQEPDGVFRARDIDMARNERAGGYDWTEQTPLIIPTKSKIEIRAIDISANNGAAVGKFKLHLVTEDEPR